MDDVTAKRCFAVTRGQSSDIRNLKKPEREVHPVEAYFRVKNKNISRPAWSRPSHRAGQEEEI